MTLPVLGPEGFRERVAAMGRVVVMFTADWCPFCRAFEPTFRAAAARRAGPFALADISDDDTDPRWDDYGIAVVPTVLVLERGEVAARLDGALGAGIPARSLESFLQRHADGARGLSG